MKCPSCGKRGPDLERYGYCARCDAFTVLCDAGRSITAESMLKAEHWARTCTDLAPARYRLLTLAGDLVQAQLCPAHAAAAASAGLPLELVPVRPGRTARHAYTLGHALHMIFVGVSDEDVALALQRRAAWLATRTTPIT